MIKKWCNVLKKSSFMFKSCLIFVKINIIPQMLLIEVTEPKIMLFKVDISEQYISKPHTGFFLCFILHCLHFVAKQTINIFERYMI